MKFTKMQGLGNDYIYLDGMQGLPEDLPELARRLSDRHFGVGGDGLICVCPSKWADFQMRMFNADGSEGRMCGNGIRCLGTYVYEKGLTDKTDLTIETLSGLRSLTLLLEEGRVAQVTVDMGRPALGEWVRLEAGGETYEGRLVSMGNPHLVLFLPQVGELALGKLGPALSRHRDLGEEVNVEFVQVLAPDRLKLRVWERGSGETLACGTGTCAALSAGAAMGACARRIRAELPGGLLRLHWDEEDGHIRLTGPGVTVFEGEIEEERVWQGSTKTS